MRRNLAYFFIDSSINCDILNIFGEALPTPAMGGP
jgi:hypothetical protein